VTCCPRTILAITLMRLRGTPLEFIAIHFGIEDNSAYKFFRSGLMAIIRSRDLFIDHDPFGWVEKEAHGFGIRFRYELLKDILCAG